MMERLGHMRYVDSVCIVDEVDNGVHRLHRQTHYMLSVGNCSEHSPLQQFPAAIWTPLAMSFPHHKLLNADNEGPAKQPTPSSTLTDLVKLGKPSLPRKNKGVEC